MVRRLAIMTILGAPLVFSQSAKKLTDEELAKLLEKPGALFFLDVREPQEIKAGGSLPGYVNIPIGQLEARLSEVPKNKPVVTA
jgi:rhodanese-related sulfurtransferase